MIIDKYDKVNLIDFNVSRDFNQNKLMTKTGQIEFNAPEIISNTCYNELVDVWAAGITIYAMAAKTLPYYDENIVRVAEMIQTEPIDFSLIKDETYNDLLVHMLDKDPSTRWNIRKCLEHQLFGTLK